MEKERICEGERGAGDALAAGFDQGERGEAFLENAVADGIEGTGAAGLGEITPPCIAGLSSRSCAEAQKAAASFRTSMSRTLPRSK